QPLFLQLYVYGLVCVCGGGVGVRYKFQASIPGTFSAYQPSFTQCPGLESVTVLVGASLIEQSREAGEKGDDILFLDEA
ncbi:MAG: hypothetical protein ACK559_10755, partial [bacterium]